MKKCIDCNKWKIDKFFKIYRRQYEEIEVYNKKTDTIEKGYQCAYCYIDDLANSTEEREKQLDFLNELQIIEENNEIKYKF